MVTLQASKVTGISLPAARRLSGELALGFDGPFRDCCISTIVSVVCTSCHSSLAAAIARMLFWKVYIVNRGIKGGPQMRKDIGLG